MMRLAENSLDHLDLWSAG